MQTQIVKDYLRYFSEELQTAIRLCEQDAQPHLRAAEHYAEALILQLGVLLRARNARLKDGAVLALQELQDALTVDQPRSRNRVKSGVY